MIQTDVLILGCGIAGATAALRLAQNPNATDRHPTRDPDPHESNTRYAQGGIIGRGQDDNADLLVEDILAAGAGATAPKAARILAEEGPALLQEILVETAGIHFDSDDDGEPGMGQGSRSFPAAHPACRRRHRPGDHPGVDGGHAKVPEYHLPHPCHRGRPDHLSAPFARPAGPLTSDRLPRRVCL